jgi:hypothetical protein
MDRQIRNPRATARNSEMSLCAVTEAGAAAVKHKPQPVYSEQAPAYWWLRFARESAVGKICQSMPLSVVPR